MIDTTKLQERLNYYYKLPVLTEREQGQLDRLERLESQSRAYNDGVINLSELEGELIGMNALYTGEAIV